MLLRTLATVVLAATPSAQAPEFLPGVKYDSSVPTPLEILGHDFGERISSYADTLLYATALAEATPRVEVIYYDEESWERRKLFYLAIGSSERVQGLQEIKANMRELADPRTLTASRIGVLTRSLPAVVWLAYGVHGDEISGTDAGLLTAYHLAAASPGERVADAARESCVVLIDPVQNPDGRDRFVNYFRRTTGRWPDPDDQAAEHNQTWPGGRTNHYLFDMNRDWFALTQPETRGRVKAFLEWYPLVYVDLHEMGTNSTYYFPPPADPINPQITPDQVQWLEAFGRNNARWFDRMQFDYFTGEVYDAFYPGYGEGWPMLHGAIGMTYEQASVRGLVVKREDEIQMEYRDSVERHFIASLATIETAAQQHQGLLKSFAKVRRDASAERAEDEIAEYLLAPGRDPNRTRKLVKLLMDQGIEVKRAERGFRHDVRPLTGGESAERDLPAGTFVVSVAQPARLLLQTLMARQEELSEEFVAEQERRRAKRMSTQFYDVTSWSLPLLYDVECYVAKSRSTGSLRVLEEAPKAAGHIPERLARLAYLIPWGTNSAARALAALQHQDVRVFCADKEFVLGGVEYPPGSLIIKVKDNKGGLHPVMQAVARDTGATVIATDTGWVEKGIGLGSNHVRFLRKPKVALAYGRPTNPYSVGWARYLLERQYGYPVTILHTRQIPDADLSRYNVLILPEGRGYGEFLNRGVDRIKAWIRSGGTLVTLGSSTQWLSGDEVGLLATKPEDRDKVEGEAAKTGEKAEAQRPEEPAAEAAGEPFDFEAAIQPDVEPPARTPGAIARITVDGEHWLGFGYDGDANVLVRSSDIYTPIKLDKGRNIGVYGPAENVVISGFTWEESIVQLASKAYLVWQPVGDGHVVAFAEDPNFRAYCDGLNLLFLNAVFFGPGH